MEYNTPIQCLDCLHRAPFNDDGWCEIHKVAVADTYACDMYECIDL